MYTPEEPQLPSNPPSFGWSIFFLSIIALFVFGITEYNARGASGMGLAIGGALGTVLIASGISYFFFTRHHRRLRAIAGVALFGAAGLGVFTGQAEQTNTLDAQIESLEALATGQTNDYRSPQKTSGQRSPEEQLLDIIGEFVAEKKTLLSGYREQTPFILGRLFAPNRLQQDRDMKETLSIFDSLWTAFEALETSMKTSKANTLARMQELPVPIVQKDRLIRKMNADSIDLVGAWIALERESLMKLRAVFTYLGSESNGWTFDPEIGLRFRDPKKQTKLQNALKEIKELTTQQDALAARSDAQAKQGLDMIRNAR